MSLLVLVCGSAVGFEEKVYGHVAGFPNLVVGRTITHTWDSYTPSGLTHSTGFIDAWDETYCSGGQTNPAGYIKRPETTLR